MTEKKPKPIRLTKTRALALLSAVDAGVTAWEADVKRMLAESPTDLEVMRQAKELDLLCGRATDAMQIVRDRYITHPPKKEPDALF